ncbi:hypothetical protein H0Z60_15820, partial [Ectothiorhodospiraceae bacterium WFHF3C12]|nr:hypothetical protein [Ectothiorhodospiraceae bacterium WFHF3C12]
MRTPGITAKLFLAILGVTLAVVLLMTLTTQLAFRSDFVDYLEERERDRIETLADVLGDYYRAEGTWLGLEQPGRWRDVLREAAWRHRHDDDRDHHRRDDDDDDDDDEDDDHDGHGDDEHHRAISTPSEWRGNGSDRGPPRAAAPVPFGPTLLDGAGRRVAGPPLRGDDI